MSSYSVREMIYGLVYQMRRPLSGGGVPGGVLDGELVQGGVSGMVRGGMQPKHTLVGQGP